MKGRLCDPKPDSFRQECRQLLESLKESRSQFYQATGHPTGTFQMPDEAWYLASHLADIGERLKSPLHIAAAETIETLLKELRETRDQLADALVTKAEYDKAKAMVATIMDACKPDGVAAP